MRKEAPAAALQSFCDDFQGKGMEIELEFTTDFTLHHILVIVQFKGGDGIHGLVSYEREESVISLCFPYSLFFGIL